MASKSRKAFDDNMKDVKQLMKLHAGAGGGARGRRYGLEVLNKSAIVLITAIWEAYCEDLAAEALAHLVEKAASGESLPKELKKRIASEIKKDTNELAMWDLADEGWRTRVSTRLSTLMDERNRRLNTPKAAYIDALFNEAIGLEEVSDAWHWKNMTADQAKNKLDSHVELRGAIAHRGAASSGVKKAQVTSYLNHVIRLVGKTGGRVNTHVKKATGKPLW